MKIVMSLSVLCFVTTITIAQEKLDCDFNYRAALLYLKGGKYVKKDSLRSIEYLKPCLSIGDANAQLLMGRLYAAKGDEESYKKAFALYSNSATQGNAIAMADLGVLYKYGRGCKINVNKAKKWFIKSANLGNDKGAYSLGYLYLKGYGGVAQDYFKAVEWFKKSEHKMAKYWLGVCYYYGYGINKNIEKANELLGTNFEKAAPNKNTNFEFSHEIITTSNGIEIATEHHIIKEDISDRILLGKWTGSLLKYDWSGKYIEHNYPISIFFNKDSTSNTLVYTIEIHNQKVTRALVRYDNTVYFENTTIELPHTSFDVRIPTTLNYEFINTELNIIKTKTSNYLEANITSYISSWNEVGAPLKLILKKSEALINTNEELAKHPSQGANPIEEDFIKLYPNPFQNDLIVSYTLKEQSFVEIKITDINSTTNNIIKKREAQSKGSYRCFFDASSLKKGIYIISVLVNNERKTKVVVKN